MKLVLVLAALLPSVASAEPSFWCKETDAGIDHGYYVNFSSPIRYATVSTQSIAGPQKLAELNCSYLASTPEDHGSNQPYLSCSEPNKRDAGYSLLLSSELGKITATVYQVTIAGSQAIAHLTCGRF
jgi:hypothetical protein